MSHRGKFLNPHKLNKHLVKLSKDSRLKKETVKQLLFFFSAVTKQHGHKMPRSLFRNEMVVRFNLMDDFMLDNLYRCFDLKNRGFLTSDEYIKGMGMFLSDDMDVKAKLCFQVYDLNGDGFITREEMAQWLKTAILRQSTDDDSDEGTKELIDIIVKKLDCVDHDNRVSMKDFRQAVNEDVLLLESLSSCLPPLRDKKAFMLMISGDLRFMICPSGPSAPPRLQDRASTSTSSSK